MRKKYKKIILFTVLSFVIFSFGYLMAINKNLEGRFVESEQQAAKKDWSIYHDGKYRFSIKYQPGALVGTIYNFSVDFPKEDLRESYVVDGGVSFSSFDSGTTIYVFDNNPYPSLENWLEDQNEQNPLSHYIISDRQTVDSISAISIQEEDTEKDFKTTAFIKDGKLFVVFTEDEANFNNFLETFKFD